MSKRKSKKTNKLTDEQINKIGEKMGRENFLEGESGDLGRTVRVPINSDSCRVYTLRSSLGYIYAFQHPAVFIEGEHVPQHCRHLSGALKISNLGSALNLKAKFEVNLRIKYEVEELEMELRSFSLSSTSLSCSQMNLTEAINILIRNAAKGVSGTGTGIREEISEDEKRLVRRAIIIVWPYTGNAFLPNDSYFRNMGI